jgi:hypothetical protein
VCYSLLGRVGKEDSGNSAPGSSPGIDILIGFKMIKTRRKMVLTASTATICPVGEILRYNRPEMRHIGPLSEL